MQVDEKNRVPYPIDKDLISEAQLIGNGRYVHDINRSIANYRSHIKIWEVSWEAYKWYDCVKAERELRGIVVEAKLNKNYHAPWAQT